MSTSFDIKIFHNFYEQNKKVFDYIPLKSHPINEENFNKWISNHNPYNLNELKDLTILASLFRKYSRHVSYTEYRAKVASICASIRSQKDNYDSIVLCVNSNMNKSNFWVAMLNYHFLNDIITDVVGDELINYSPKNGEKALGIICDDASYTGSQLSGMIGRIPDYIDVVISVPYMSKTALSKIKSISKNILFPSEIEIFLNFYENLSKDVINGKKGGALIIAKKYKFFDKKYTIYFDHKLADMYSIYQDIYSFGIPLNIWGSYSKPEDIKFIPVSLITGCDLTPYLKEWIEGKYSNDDIQDIFSTDLQKMCPIPFYKLFQYTYNGKKIKSIYELRN